METSAKSNGNSGTGRADVSATIPAIAQPLSEEPTEIASNIKYHAHFSPHFSPFKFEPEQAYYATADSVRDRLIKDKLYCNLLGRHQPAGLPVCILRFQYFYVMALGHQGALFLVRRMVTSFSFYRTVTLCLMGSMEVLFILQHHSCAIDIVANLNVVVCIFLLQQWNDTYLHYDKVNPKQTYYLSMEYLQGRTLTNAIGNLDIHNAYADALKKLGHELEEVVEQLFFFFCLDAADSHDFSLWKAQVSMLMRGHNLYGHLDETIPAPANAILASLDTTLAATVATATTAKAAWDSLHTAYANKLRTHIFSLRDHLACLTKESLTVTDYLNEVRSFCDELATAGAPVTNDELIVKILTGLGPEYRDISAAIHARDTPISYAELFEKLIDHELFLKHNAPPYSTTITAAVAHKSSSQIRANITNNNRRQNNYQQQQQQCSQPGRNRRTNPQEANLVCQLCDRPGHSARACHSQSHNHFQARANFAEQKRQQSAPWIVDSGATHHVASDTLSLTDITDYNGSEEITMGNGNTIPISHAGNTDLAASNSSFQLSNILCSPSIASNLISVSQFCRDNKTSIEFFPFSYLVKDLSTGAPLVQGRSRGRLYEWPPNNASSSQPQCNVAVSLDLWHRHLGHPPRCTLDIFLNKFFIPVKKDSLSICNSCQSNKTPQAIFFYEFLAESHASTNYLQ
ncbi:putative U-box domain-containing protein 9-like [Capsicum annuum]|nr:putative U-box domain-containing protein 9-like [Capsicum annuum]